uniref:(California timema) hypothetical protein n=1 Tax=Timema californicum TaxID=61474 RepID=A0A7R9JDN8_TIMCA|nr:unnamed protein product [Timema californicum]
MTVASHGQFSTLAMAGLSVTEISGFSSELVKPPYQRGRFRQNQRNMRGRGGQRGGHQNQLQLLGKGLKMRDR